MEDLKRVIEASGVSKPYLMGISEGGPMSLLFAATYPNSIRGLILYGSMACGIPDAQVNPGGPRWVALCERLRAVVENWGQGMLLDVFSPTLAGRPIARQLGGAAERSMASSSMAMAAYQAVLETDVRDVLPVIETPTVILHRVGDAMPIEGSRHMAEAIKNARLVELPGSDHFWFVGDSDLILDAIEELVVGSRASRSADRVLSSFLYTDIVDSTRLAASMGDDAWRRTLDDHNRLSRDQFEQFRGNEIASTGDGFLVTFDGPARAVRCASAVIRAVGTLGLSLRSGVHTGECEVLADGNIGGLAVHVGARVVSVAGPDEIVVSSTVRDLAAGSGMTFADIGEHTLKGVPDPMRLYRVFDVPEWNGPRETAMSSQAVPDARPRVSQRAIMTVARKAPRTARRVTALVYGRSDREAVPDAGH